MEARFRVKQKVSVQNTDPQESMFLIVPQIGWHCRGTAANRHAMKPAENPNKFRWLVREKFFLQIHVFYIK